MDELAGHEEVISVFPDRNLKLHTTRSWDFLNEESGVSSSNYSHYQHNASTDIIIGMIDTGNTSSFSFSFFPFFLKPPLSFNINI